MMTFGSVLDTIKAQGIDPAKIWSSVATSAKDLVTSDLPKAVVQTVQSKAASVAEPVVQSAAQAKAKRVISKGNIAATAGIGLLAGALISGGSWKRRAVGGAVGAILGGLAGLKIGLVSD